MHLPNIAKLPEYYRLKAVMSRTGHNAKDTARQFQADYATTDYADLLKDGEIDAIIIATRHDLHAEMALAALRAGKHTLVEKPLATREEDLAKIREFYEKQSGPLLLTGFNRRFSKYARKIKELVGGRQNPLLINYRMNAGYLPPDSWVHGEEGGGRNIGEACHIYDLFNCLVGGAAVLDVKAMSAVPQISYYTARDNFVATVSYADGSVASLSYTAFGAKNYPKERMEIHFEGSTLLLDDYKKLVLFKNGKESLLLSSGASDKGQKEELESFAACLLSGAPWPNPLDQQLKAMEIAFRVEEML
jgi:predicted dehydrogenase